MHLPALPALLVCDGKPGAGNLLSLCFHPKTKNLSIYDLRFDFSVPSFDNFVQKGCMVSPFMLGIHEDGSPTLSLLS